MGVGERGRASADYRANLSPRPGRQLCRYSHKFHGKSCIYSAYYNNLDSFLRQALTHALYDLAAHPQYIEAMREEVEAVISSEGWTKAAMGKMWKVDSFLKESQRMAIGGRKALLYPRKVLRSLFLF